MKLICRGAMIVALLLPIGCGGSDEDPMTPTPPSGPPSKTLVSSLDNTLYEDAAGTISNGIGQWMFAGVTKGNTPGNTDPPEIRRAVFKFDIAAAGIPGGSTIDSVILTLTLENPPNGINGARTLGIHRLTNSWGEGPSQPLNPNEGGGAPAETGDATWLHRFFSATMWNQPGGDFAGGASDSTIVGDAPGKYTWGSTTMMVADVQLWFDTPLANNGWILIGDESTNQTAKRFATRERPVAADRPTLLIYYTEP